jgi:hypothetical protein
MRDWVDRMNGAGASVINGKGLICQETPDDEMLNQCESLGKQMAEITVSHKMVRCAVTEAEKCKAEIARCHTSSGYALNEILQ